MALDPDDMKAIMGRKHRQAAKRLFEALDARLTALEGGVVEPDAPEFRAPGDFADNTELWRSTSTTGPLSVGDPALVEDLGDGTVILHAEERPGAGRPDGRTWFTGLLTTRPALYFGGGQHGAIVDFTGRAVAAVFSYSTATGRECDFELTLKGEEAGWTPNIWMPRAGGGRASASYGKRVMRRAPLHDGPQKLVCDLRADRADFYYQNLDAALTPVGPWTIFETITPADLPADAVWDSTTPDLRMFVSVEKHREWAGWAPDDYAQPAAMRVHAITPRGVPVIDSDGPLAPDTPDVPVTLTVTPAADLREDASVGSLVATVATDATTIAVGGADATALMADGLDIVTATSLAGRTTLDFTVRGSAAGKTDTTVAVSIPVVEVPDEPEEPGTPPTGALAYGVSGVNDWGASLHYIDLMRMARGFDADTMSHRQLRDGGYLDPLGYPLRIPPGAHHVGTIWDWGGDKPTSHDVAGRHVLTYDGDGDFLFHLGSTVVSREPGRVVLDIRAGSPFAFLITRITEGDHPRNMHIVREDHAALHAAGVMFRPEWTRIARKARIIRFMPWSWANSGEWIDGQWTIPAWMGDWSKRDLPGAVGGQVPLDDICTAANDLNDNPWFTMPAMADDMYFREAGRLVRDSVAPHLEVRPELGNEVWNFAFPAGHVFERESRARWGANWMAMFMHRAIRLAQIWNEVWAERDGPKPKLIHTLNGQTGQGWLADQLVNARELRRVAPDLWVDPKTLFAEYGISNYFGVGVMLQASSRDALLARIAADPVGARAWLRDGLLDGSLPTSIPSLLAQNRAVKAAVSPLKLVAYEGGTHVHHTFATGLTQEQIAASGAWLEAFSYSDEMADLYEAWADAWEQVGDGPHMQFVDVSESGIHGSWGARRSLRDDNPRSRVVDSLADRPAWWT